MEILPSGGENAEKRLVVHGEGPVLDGAAPWRFPREDDLDQDVVGGSSLDLLHLLRTYWAVLLVMMILGSAAGFVSVILTLPVYKARLLLEVQSMNDAFMKNSFEVITFEANEVNIQTQINILRSGPFLKRGADRMQSETVPLTPTGQGLISRLRQRIRPATRDPFEDARRGLNTAITSFDARPLNKTRLIELSCESTSPDVAAQFLNSMAAEFVEDTSRSRMQTSQKTGEWLSAQTEETKSKLRDSEERLRDFVQASGNLFVGQETTTLDDSKLAQLKAELAKIQADRIAKQTRYELTFKYPPESLAEVLNDPALKASHDQIATLRREKAALGTTYTAKHEKIRRLDAQIELLDQTYQSEITSMIKRIRGDYEAALRQEKLLSSAYAGQSQRVGAEAGKAAQYNALKREVETLRQLYQSLLTQESQIGLSSSVPINPIRIVEASSPPETPSRPRPPLNIAFGGLMGILIAGGFVFLREKMDDRIKSPGSTRLLLNTPQLGVIPKLAVNGNSAMKDRGLKRLSPSAELIIPNDAKSPETATVTWQHAPAFVTESFRSTLTSILRKQVNGNAHKTILVTSAGPSEGKTTVVQNLGIALAETGKEVLLIDADFRRPHLHNRFGLPNEVSLIDLLDEDKPPSESATINAVLRTGLQGLSILPNRSSDRNVAKALYSAGLPAVMTTLRNRYDMILVDAPPILPLADARIIAPLADAVILVLRCGITDRERALEAYQRIRSDGLALLGTVLTDWKSRSASKRSYDYYYADNPQP